LVGADERFVARVWKGRKTWQQVSHHHDGHHGNAQANVDLYAICAAADGSVKRTVNPRTIRRPHTLLRDAHGTPGTLLSFCGWQEDTATGARGVGQQSRSG
jgi:hypothetical protein